MYNRTTAVCGIRKMNADAVGVVRVCVCVYLMVVMNLANMPCYIMCAPEPLVTGCAGKQLFWRVL